MCGRGACSLDPRALKEKCNVEKFWNSDQYSPSYNLCPNDFIPVLLLQDEMLKYYQTSKPTDNSIETADRKTAEPIHTSDDICGPNENTPILRAMRWGLIPSFSKDGTAPYSLINANRDNVKSTGIYNRLIKRKRCVVLFNGYYEWQKTQNSKHKQPYYFTPKYDSNHNNKSPTASNDSPLMYMAALWDIWRPRNDDNPNHYLFSVSIITTAASKDVSFCHHRMPLVMPEACVAKWLNTEYTIDECFKMIDESQRLISIQSYAVPRELVGNTKRKGIECIQSMDEYEAQKRKTGLHKYFQTAKPIHVQKKRNTKRQKTDTNSKNKNAKSKALDNGNMDMDLMRAIEQSKEEMKVEDDELKRAMEASKMLYETEEKKRGTKRKLNEIGGLDELDEQPAKKQKLNLDAT